MRSHVRTIVVLAVALALIALFLYNVNLWGVLTAIARARPEWLALALATTFINLAIRALRWKFLLEPLGGTTFANAFRATAVGFAASAVLPARAGEVIRPYFLARQTPPAKEVVHETFDPLADHLGHVLREHDVKSRLAQIEAHRVDESEQRFLLGARSDTLHFREHARFFRVRLFSRFHQRIDGSCQSGLLAEQAHE